LNRLNGLSVQAAQATHLIPVDSKKCATVPLLTDLIMIIVRPLWDIFAVSLAVTSCR
jgi:hypothetical protein